MKYSLFLADAPRTLGKPDYPSYPQLLSVECAAGSQARQLAQALPHSALTVAGRPLETLTVGATPLTPGACLEPGRTQLTQPAAVSTLYVLRGPDAGHAYPIPRGHTHIGRSQKNNQAVALNDPYLAPNHGTLVVDGSGARLILSHPPRSKNLAALPLPHGVLPGASNNKEQEIRWNEPFIVGSSTCLLTAPGQSPALPQSTGSPFEPVTSPTQAARKLGTLIIMVCLPLIIGVAVATLTGMWMFLLMSLASSALMLLHMLSGRGENKRAQREVHNSGEREKLRAEGLTPAGARPFIPAADQSAAAAIVLGVGPRLPFVSGRNLNVSSLKPHKRAPHYVPVPTAALPHELHLKPEHLHAYLVQLVAVYPGEVIVLAPASAATVVRDALVCLGVHERVRLCVSPEQIAEALAVTVPEPQESFLPSSQPAAIPPLFISAGVPRGGTGVFPTRAALCIVHPHDTAHIPALNGAVLSLQTVGEYQQSISYVRSGPAPAELTPAESVGQVHPLELNDSCATADGLSIAQYVRALGALAGSGESDSVAEATDAASVHSRSLRLSELDSLNGENAHANGIDPMGLLCEEAAARWAMNRYSPDLYCLLGSAPGGYLDMGLSEHGPHWIVGGTTGAGKSQLLRSLILTVALRYGPERLGLILVDFKGSAGLGPLAQLPQTLSMLSNFDVSAVHRALEFLRADVRRRERDLLSLGVNSYRDYLRLCAASGEIPAYPELVIVVDEFRMLVESMPDAMNELMKIATIGRSLGLHLILATQRPQGSISQDIRANIASNICLRVSSGQDSFNLVGHEGAASIPASCPGAGYVRLPDGQNLPFRAPLVDALPSNTVQAPFAAQLLQDGAWVPLISPVAQQDASDDSQGEDAQLNRAVQLIREAFESYAVSAGDYQPIPQELAAHTELTVSSREFEYTLGELEIARYGVRQPRTWGISCGTSAASGAEQEEAAGALAVLGAVGERSNLLNAMLAQAAQRGERIIVLTADSGLHRRLACAYTEGCEVFDALVGPHELSHLQYCLQQLRSGYTVPGREGQQDGALVVVDGLDSWLELLMRLPQVEGQLYDLLAQGHRYGYRVVFTSALSLRGRFASVAHSTLLSRRFVENDLMRKTVKNYPVPAQGHFAVEGTLNTDLIGDEPLEASVLSPVTLSSSELTKLLQDTSGRSHRVRPLVQFPEGISLPAQDAVLDVHRKSPGALLCGYQRDGSAALIHAPQGTFVPVPGARSSGKSTFLQNLSSLNPQYGVLHIAGANNPDAQQLRETFENVPHPERVILAVDDVPYISAATQQVLLEFGRKFRAGFIAYTPYTRWLSSPVLASLSGCSRAVVINPRTAADGEICTLSELPLDLYTEGTLPPGRAVAVDAGRATACQLPSAV